MIFVSCRSINEIYFQSNYPQSKYYKKKLAPDGERKIARWEKKEQKLGPPK